MKKIWTTFLLTGFLGLTVQVTGVGYVFAANRITAQTPIIGDDLFPWPWGSECPFPWRDINGTWKVIGPKGAYYNGHILIFDVQTEDEKSVKFLEIDQYSSTGAFYAGGHGYSEKNKRIVKGILKTDVGNKNYVVMVRSYSKDQKTCRGSDLVTAVTFCPVRGKRCMDDSNYILERFEPAD